MVTASFGSIARGTESQAANTTATCMRHSFALVMIAAVITFFAAPPLVPLIYGKQFVQAGTIARLLLPGIIAYSMMPTLGTFFAQQLGKPRIPLIFSSLSTMICAAMTVVLLPHFGIAGGAVATSISYCTAFAAAVTYFVHRTRIAPRRIFTLSRTDLEPYRALLSRRLFSLRG
jgi:O-antigen/teichoic acid export membrane protein